MKELFGTIFSKDHVDPAGQYDKQPALYGSFFFMIISAILTLMNASKHFWFMTAATLVLTVGFLTCGLLALRDKQKASSVLFAILCATVFSIFAVTGENEGFAILWIILVPVFSSLVLGLRIGCLLGLYFQAFLIVLFYTPLSAYVSDFYTPTFIMRFPILYFSSFGFATFLMCQRQKLYNRIHWQAYHDDLTDLYNRRCFHELCKSIQASGSYNDLTVFSFDLNGLKTINDTSGHEAGDRLILGTAKLLSDAFHEDQCFRIGGDEFAVISRREAAADSIARLREAEAQWRANTIPEASIAIGYASAAEHPGLTVEELLRMADRNMYADKSDFYRAYGIERSYLKVEV